MARAGKLDAPRDVGKFDRVVMSRRPPLGRSPLSATLPAPAAVVPSPAAVAVGIAIGWALVAAPASAQTEPRPRRAVDVETPRGLAMGTGVRASAGSTSAAAYGAAALPIAPTYHVDALVGYAPGGNQLSFGGIVADSMTSAINAALAVRGFASAGDEGHSGWDGKLALALPVSDQLALGVTGRYLSLTQEGDARRGDAQDGDSLVKGFTMGASLRLSLGDEATRFHVTALGENLIDRGSALVPRRVGGSGALVIDGFTVGGDVLVDLDTYDNATVLAGGGLEILAGGHVPIRAGWRFDDGRDEHALTAGIGYLETSFGAELSLRQFLIGSRSTELLVSLRYFVN